MEESDNTKLETTPKPEAEAPYASQTPDAGHSQQVAEVQQSVTGKGSGFSFWKVILPVAIGIGVVVWLFFHDARKEGVADVWSHIHFDARSIFCIILAFIFMIGRDFGMSWRFRALTDRELPWKSAFEVDFLCEFTSCVTPSAVGGSSMGMVFLNTKGIEFGRATTLMMTTLFLDELFFVITCPIIVLVTPVGELFSASGDVFGHGIAITFWIVYAILCIWTLILFVGIIAKPLWVKKVLDKVTRIKFLRKWHDKALELGDNMIATSKELKTKPFRFWFEVYCGTALSWTSRYLVVNALFWGFVAAADPYQWLIFAKEFVLWIVLMVSPTPGGAGLSEWLFSEYYGNLVPTIGTALILAVFWRIISYYVYLLIGSILIPGWLKNSVARLRTSKQTEAQKQ